MAFPKLKAKAQADLFEAVNALQKKANNLPESVLQVAGDMDEHPKKAQSLLDQIAVQLDKYKLTEKAAEQLIKGYDFVEFPGDMSFIDADIEAYLDEFVDKDEDPEDAIVEEYLRRRKIRPDEVRDYLAEIKKEGFDKVDWNEVRTTTAHRMYVSASEAVEEVKEYIIAMNVFIRNVLAERSIISKALEQIYIQIDQVLKLKGEDRKKKSKELDQALRITKDIEEDIDTIEFVINKLRSSVINIKMAVEDFEYFLAALRDPDFDIDDPVNTFHRGYIEFEESLNSALRKIGMRI